MTDLLNGFQQDVVPNVRWDRVWDATVETLYMMGVSILFTAIFGVILGILLYMTAEGNPWQNQKLYRAVSAFVNIFRSIPFIILLILLVPIIRALLGSAIGAKTAIPALVIGAAPFYARLVEIGLREIPKGVVEAAKSMGASNLQIIYKVLLPESKPALVSGITVTGIALIGYVAMAGLIGAGGLGHLAFMGYQRHQWDVIWISTINIIIMVQIFQMLGDFIVRKIDKR
ncbi:methionine ABC transporter permease [Caldalkalibacillus salinus]|uniref:methionine ABC transporter permease n=1 Tax=Caldalkalibacillus salinus TaxID=2803787 RepID=UPI0019245D29|nr:methionine ABC transporter permease [Caldalkalibacillus salinus]